MEYNILLNILSFECGELPYSGRKTDVLWGWLESKNEAREIKSLEKTLNIRLTSFKVFFKSLETKCSTCPTPFFRENGTGSVPVPFFSGNGRKGAPYPFLSSVGMVGTFHAFHTLGQCLRKLF